MYEKLVLFALKRTKPAFRVDVAKNILEDIQIGSEYRINNQAAKSIIEAVVKSVGNKIVDYIIKD